MKIVYLVSLCVLLFACNTKTGSNNNRDSVVNSAGKIPETRSVVNPNPVKIYTETIKSFETTDEFKVALFETTETYNYLIKISYKNLEAEDTLRIPNFGQIPAAEIKTGDKRPSCIAGFLDNDKQFRESKLIYFDDNGIKIHVLKHYGVYMK